MNVVHAFPTLHGSCDDVMLHTSYRVRRKCIEYVVVYKKKKKNKSRFLDFRYRNVDRKLIVSYVTSMSAKLFFFFFLETLSNRVTGLDNPEQLIVQIRCAAHRFSREKCKILFTNLWMELLVFIVFLLFPNA